MLLRLSVRNVVLIDRLDLDFGPGLCVLTGETGAGKSILLDALGLALGKRADTSLLRAGTDRASVTATFDVEADHPARDWLDDRGFDPEEDVLLRRTLAADGRSRAFVNDQSVTVAALAELAGLLVEIYGQHDRLGLMDTRTHRVALDGFAGLAPVATSCHTAHGAWRDAHDRLAAAEREAADDATRREELAGFVADIDALEPLPGEETTLADERSFLMAAEKIVAGLNAASQALNGIPPADQAIRTAHALVAEVAPAAAGRLDELCAALARAVIEVDEAASLLDAAGTTLEVEPRRLEAIEERLFGLRALARRHGVEVDGLAAARTAFAARLQAIEAGDDALAAQRLAVEEMRETFRAMAETLSAARAAAANRLDKMVNRELPPLKLAAARFATRLEALEEDRWGPDGAERIAFVVATNPGQPAGDLGAIASGGELSRLMLALSVALAQTHGIATLVFDEIDAGIGGATAHAVGERLARLGTRAQVLVVTHQPQVAAQAGVHFRVAKASVRNTSETSVEPLDDAARLEEVARMLAGAEVTEQARAAASRLLDGGSEASTTA